LLSKKARIIIIEDDKDILDSLKEIIKSDGYEVDTASNGEEGIKKCRANSFDLALLDIKLPGIDGTEVLEILHKEFPEMVKIMITGYPSLENAVASLKKGADAYLMKPVNPSRLLEVIDKKLSERSKESVKV